MKKIILFILIFPILSFITRSSVQADSTPQYKRGVITQIVKMTEIHAQDAIGYIQDVLVKDDDGKQQFPVQMGSENIPLTQSQLHYVGQHVVILLDHDQALNPVYTITDQYRIPTMVYLLIAFFLIVVAIARVKGITSIISMIFSVAVLLFFMVPQITHGANPIEISIISSVVIGASMIYLGHGWSNRSHVALLCVFTTLLLVAGLSSLMVRFAALSGAGDESATYLQYSGSNKINLQGLYLEGIILAALSVLDDSVISQVSIVYQLKKVKEHITLKELYLRGMEVGKDHISILVNTLILAYAGSSLPLFILFTQATQPHWVSLNDQLIAEEVVRTLTGSIGLVLSIPLTTIIVSYALTRQRKTVSLKKS